MSLVVIRVRHVTPYVRDEGICLQIMVKLEDKGTTSLQHHGPKRDSKAFCCAREHK